MLFCAPPLMETHPLNLLMVPTLAPQLVRAQLLLSMLN
jgi:hypothetical protein